MAQRLPRHLGKPESMDPGQWCVSVMDRDGQIVGLTVLRCPGCGLIKTLDSGDIGQSGRLGHEFICSTCSTRDYIELESWDE